MINSRIGPKTLTQHLSIMLSRVGAVLSETKSPTCHLMQRHTRWHMLSRSMKRRSHSTWSLNERDTSNDATEEGDGLRHKRQILQVSTVSAMSFKTSAGQPAAFNVRSMAAAGACHHRKCNLRSTRRRAASPPDRKARREAPMSNLVQSLGASPVVASR